MLLKALLQWVSVAGSIISVFAVPTRTSSIDASVEAIELPERISKLEPRATQPPQAIHFIGFTNAQIAIVRRAIEDAAWLGQMGSQQLQGLTSINQLSPEFRTYFGNHYTDGNMAAIRGWRTCFLPLSSEILTWASYRRPSCQHLNESHNWLCRLYCKSCVNETIKYKTAQLIIPAQTVMPDGHPNS